MLFRRFDANAIDRCHAKRTTTWAAVYALAYASAAFADERVTLQVWPLSVYEDSEGAYHGHCQPLTLTVVRNAPGSVRVGFFESEVGGSGPQWRSAGWTAIMTAAQLLDFDRRIGEVSFEIQGRIDGPSAGALMTVGVLAAARGDRIRPDATMTGTINPDGIIGPVGGIPHKLDGAAHAGKKLVLIPAGIPYQKDQNTGATPDLVTLGNRLGVEVVPVLDIFAAYQKLTGAELPRASAYTLDRADSVIYDMTDEIMNDWLDRARKVWKIWEEHPETMLATPERQAFAKAAKNFYQSGANLWEEGEYCASLHDALEGIRGHYLTQEAERCELVYRQSGEGAMIARIRNNDWLTKAVEDSSKTLGDFTPQNLNQLGIYLEAIDAFLTGISYRALAATMLDQLPATEPSERAAAARHASYCQVRGWFMLKLAEDYIKAAGRLEGAAIPESTAIAELADFYRRAADANVSAFTSLAVNPAAEKQGISTSQVEFNLSLKDEEYGLLRQADRQFPAAIQRAFPAGLQRDCAQLAASLFTYCHGAMLVAKYYSLDAELDDQMEVVRLGRERTFGDWLAGSEDEALRGIGRLHESGGDSFICRYAYETAHVIEGRGLASRLEALHLLFRASVASRVLWRISQAPPNES
jgi:hypothetical protein